MIRILLASASAARQSMLAQAGVDCTAVPAHIDEAGLKAALKAEGATVETVAESLAEMKAIRITRANRDALVIGADQILDCQGVWFDKPQDRDHARAHLMALRGRRHRLISAAVVFKGGERIWSHCAQARLTMRTFSDDFIDHYLDRVGRAALSSVGAYQLEGLGAQLFDEVEGDFFTILGLPLLPLLGFLRDHRILVS